MAKEWDTGRVFRRIAVGALATGVLGIFLFTLQADSLGDGLTVGSLSLLIAAASLAAGGFIGFLFGIPRTLTSEGTTVAPGVGTIRSNTNLEQVSDWLTKILIGATLVQLGKVPSAAARLFQTIGSSLGGSSTGPAFAGALVIYYVVLGFAGGWLMTSFSLRRAMREELQREAVRRDEAGDTAAAAAIRAAVGRV